MRELQEDRRNLRSRREVRPESVAMVRRGESAFGFKISEKRVVPAVPQYPGDVEELLTDLKTIGCEGLLHRVWDLQDAKMLAEILGRAMEPALRSSFI